MDDIFENNNILSDAFNLSKDEQTLLSELGGLGVSSDDDFYKIRVTPGSLDLSIELFFTHTQGNLDLVLFDRKGNEIASSTSVDDNEFLNVTLPEAGRYFIKVTSGEVDSSGEPVFSGNTYDLRWDDIISDTTFRTIDGSENNLTHPEYGEEGIQLLRLSPAAYEDGYSEPRGGGINTPLTDRFLKLILDGVTRVGKGSPWGI